MPKTKLDDRNHRFHPIGEKIFGAAAYRRISASELSESTGISAWTLSKYRDNPGSMTINDYLTLCRLLSIPIEEVRSLVRYA